MAVGLAVAEANAVITNLGALFAKLHTGDPGAAGTSNASSEATRKAMTFGSPANGVATQSGTVSWASWSAGAATISHVSYWSAATGGTFKGSFVLTTARALANGDTFTLQNCQLGGVTPIAA